MSDTSVFFDKAAVAKLSGSPTDLAVQDNLLGVIDGGDGAISNVSLFDIDSEGELTLRFAVKIAGPSTAPRSCSNRAPQYSVRERRDRAPSARPGPCAKPPSQQ